MKITILSSELNTNYVGIKKNNCILCVTFFKMEFFTRRVYAKMHFILLVLGFEHFLSINKNFISLLHVNESSQYLQAGD